MALRVSHTEKIVLLVICALFMTACGSEEPAGLVPTAYGPLPSPKPAFTGLPLPATLAPPKTPAVGAPQSSNSPTAAPHSAGSTAKATAVTILYTNDTRGYVDPCGWGVPKGGVARRATVIKEIRQSSTGPVLLLDAGGSLFGQSLAAASNGRVVVDAMNAMGYDALAVGQLDLLQGLETLQQRAKEARFPILSCNIVSVQDGKPIFTPYAIVTRNTIRFGIIGVSEPELGTLPGLSSVARVLDPLSSVSRYLPEVRAQSDVVIVLSHLGFEMDTTLAQAVSGIQVIVGGKSRRVLTTPQTVGDTIIVQAGYDGEWLGRLDVQFTGQGQLLDPRVEIITLGPEIADDPQLAALVESHAQRFPTPTPPSR